MGNKPIADLKYYKDENFRFIDNIDIDEKNNITFTPADKSAIIIPENID